MKDKSSIKEIEERFDKDVDRFSNLDTGQLTTLDAAFNMELIVQGILKNYPQLKDVLDLGCGAGNYDVKLLKVANRPLNITLSDLSMPMLVRAQQRVDEFNQKGITHIIKGDFRQLKFDEGQFDVIIATAVLHHLREDDDWQDTFSKIFTWLKPGGSIWIFDLVEQVTDQLQKLIYHDKYGSYLSSLKDDNYRDQVFEYIQKEDSPRSLIYQLELLKKVGFDQVDVLHKNLCFASFVAFKKVL